MKKLYSFTAWKEELKEVEKLEGDKKIITKEKKFVPKEFFLKKPNRAMHEDADLFYAIELSKNVKAGLLTKAQLATKYSDEIGTMSQNDKKKYVESYLVLNDKEKLYLEKARIKEEEKTDEQKREIVELLDEITQLRFVLQELENSQQSVFDFSAESRARNKTVLWWVFNLSYFSDGKKVFGEGEFDQCLAQYDKYEEAEDDFLINISKRLLYLISFWYSGRADSAEDFDLAAKSVGLNVDPNIPEKQPEHTETAPAV